MALAAVSYDTLAAFVARHQAQRLAMNFHEFGRLARKTLYGGSGA